MSKGKVDSSVITFLMVGGQRCGSTWVYKALKEHPQIYLPSNKQSYYFDLNYEKGLEWYLSRFGDVENQHVAVGEVATGYCLPDAIPKVIEAFPDIKIILSVRDPSTRAYSYYQSRSAKYNWKSIFEAIEKDKEILERGKYIDQIEAFLEHYPKEQFLLNFFDDLKSDDEMYLKRIMDFLDIDSSWQSPVLGQVVQMAMFPKIRKKMRKLGLEPVIERISGSYVGDKIRRLSKNSNVGRYKPMDLETRKFLREYYSDYNRRLEAFSGRDLSHWGSEG